MQLKKAFTELKSIALPFVVGLSIYSSLGMLLYATKGKTDTHLLLNSVHFKYGDLFFKYLTEFGNGLVPVMLFAILLMVRFSWALVMGASGIVMGIVIQGLKRSVFAGDHRPAMFFPDGSLPSIEGIELMMHNSFPSGHSATALCVFFLLACFVKQQWATYLFVILALLTAFSRVYISQHFIEDTIVGAWIGFGIAYLGYILIVDSAEHNPKSKLNNRLWPS